MRSTDVDTGTMVSTQTSAKPMRSTDMRTGTTVSTQPTTKPSTASTLYVVAVTVLVLVGAGYMFFAAMCNPGIFNG
jgi:hypothetical protein